LSASGKCKKNAENANITVGVTAFLRLTNRRVIITVTTNS